MQKPNSPSLSRDWLPVVLVVVVLFLKSSTNLCIQIHFFLKKQIDNMTT